MQGLLNSIQFLIFRHWWKSWHPCSHWPALHTLPYWFPSWWTVCDKLETETVAMTTIEIFSENRCWCWVYKYIIDFKISEIVVKVVSVLGNIIFVQLTMFGLWMEGWQDDKSHTKNHHMQNLMATYQIVSFASEINSFCCYGDDNY